jgi:hypothetical protein
MNRDNARARVNCARMELEAAEQQLAAHWQPWRERIDRYRLSLLIGGGLLGGLALATVSPKRWSRVGAALFGGSAWLVRSAIGPAVLSALWTSISRSARTPATPRSVAPSA